MSEKTISLEYSKMVRICLSADGGCIHCALEVAEGFKNEIPEIDLEKLKQLIKLKYANM